MHKGRIKAVKAAILASGKKGLFSMNDAGLAEGVASCDTHGCIAGHAAWLFLTPKQAKRLNLCTVPFDPQDPYATNLGWRNVGAFLLDIPMRTANKLFYGYGFGGLSASPEAAAGALDKLLARKAVGHYDGPMPTPVALRKLYRRGRS